MEELKLGLPNSASIHLVAGSLNRLQDKVLKRKTMVLTEIFEARSKDMWSSRAIWMKSNLKLSFLIYQSLSVCLETKTTVNKMGQSDENKLHYCELLPDYRIKLWNLYTPVRNHFVSFTAIFRFCHLRWLLYVKKWGRDRWTLWFYIPRSDVVWAEKTDALSEWNFRFQIPPA